MKTETKQDIEETMLIIQGASALCSAMAELLEHSCGGLLPTGVWLIGRILADISREEE